jgi:hypothetical protein
MNMSIRNILFVAIGSCILLQYFLPLCLETTTIAAELSEKQKALANRYAQLELAVSRMAMATAKTDPKRAALLEKVLQLSKERLVGNRLENIVALLEKNRLNDSALGQKEVEKDIVELLQLLESENKKDVNALKREQLQKLIKDLTELYHKQRITAQRTASQDKENLKSIADEQEKLRKITDELRKNLDEYEGRNNENSKNEKSDNSQEGKSNESQNEKSDNSQEGKSNESQNEKSDKSQEGKSDKSQEGKSDKSQDGKSDKSQDGKSDKSQDGKSDKSQDGKSNESQDGESGKSQKGESGEPQDGESGKPQDGKSGKPQKGQSGGESGESGESQENEDNKSQDNSDSDDENSPQRDLRKASKHQNQAKKNLNEKKKNDAHSEMDEAAAEIIKAKEKLLKMLRQLREEELMQTLEKLNARFKRMLQVEQAIRTQTEILGKEIKLLSGDSGEMRQMKIRSSKLGEDQGSLVKEADAALVLLREDGTAQAMLESLLQVRFDIDEAKLRLDRTEVDTVTLDVEDAIIMALQEMIEAIEEAIKDIKDRPEPGTPPPSAQPSDQEKDEPLIQLLAELKMIRSMQRRVNERTERYEKLTTKKLQENPNSDLEPIRKNVEELTRQQNRISRILHEINVGKIKK